MHPALRPDRPRPARAHRLGHGPDSGPSQDALLDWQTGIANWLLDEGREEEDAASYGQASGDPRLTGRQRIRRPRRRPAMARAPQDERRGHPRRTDRRRANDARGPAGRSALRAEVLAQLRRAGSWRPGIGQLARMPSERSSQAPEASSSSAAPGTLATRLAKALAGTAALRRRRAHPQGGSGGVRCSRHSLAGGRRDARRR